MEIFWPLRKNKLYFHSTQHTSLLNKNAGLPFMSVSCYIYVYHHSGAWMVFIRQTWRLRWGLRILVGIGQKQRTARTRVPGSNIMESVQVFVQWGKSHLCIFHASSSEMVDHLSFEWIPVPCFQVCCLNWNRTLGVRVEK